MSEHYNKHARAKATAYKRKSALQDEVSRLFELIDANGDGSISKEEFIAFKSSSYI